MCSQNTAENGESSSPKEAAAEDNNSKLVPQANSNTRARRLSYVTNDVSTSDSFLYSYQPAPSRSCTSYCAGMLTTQPMQSCTLLMTMSPLSAAEHPPPAACLSPPQKSVTEKLKVDYDSSAEPETTAYTGYDGLPPAEVGAASAAQH